MPPETDLRRIETFCTEQWPEHLRNQVFWEAHPRGNSVTICETRAPFDGAGEEWTHLPLAQLRYRPEDRDWRLYWADANDLWHEYRPAGLPVTGSTTQLLAQIDADPTGVFKG